MNIQTNYNLQPLTSFGVPALVKGFAAFDSLDSLQELLAEATGYPQSLILGGGSNMLFTKPYDGLVLHNQIKGIQLLEEDNEHYYVQANAGENWHAFVQYCIAHNYAGIENLSLIPGNVGASPIQNIGAYGVEIKDVLHEVTAWHLQDKCLLHFAVADCAFGYRESIFKSQYKQQLAIVSVTFRLNKKATLHTSYGAIAAELEQMGVHNPGIREVSEAVIRIRQSKLPDPAELGNAGSFFKNPVIETSHYQQLQQSFANIPGYAAGEGLTKVPAGWLIEQAGWKGHRQGQCGVHSKQALVLVNYGGASGADIYQLSQQIIDDIQQKFGIVLEREVNVF